MIVIIDNYDSFTYNLVQYFGEMGVDLQVFRNDKITVPQIEALKPDHLVISPGPRTPKEAGCSVEAVQYFAGKIPILGVCLGHQCISEAFGGELMISDRIVHGKPSIIHHDGNGVFRGLPNPISAARYHSLIVRRETLPECLVVTAETDEREIMGIRHREFPVEGVQFHPESILTTTGKDLLRNFIGLEVPN